MLLVSEGVVISHPLSSLTLFGGDITPFLEHYGEGVGFPPWGWYPPLVLIWPWATGDVRVWTSIFPIFPIFSIFVIFSIFLIYQESLLNGAMWEFGFQYFQYFNICNIFDIQWESTSWCNVRVWISIFSIFPISLIYLIFRESSSWCMESLDYNISIFWIFFNLCDIFNVFNIPRESTLWYFQPSLQYL